MNIARYKGVLLTLLVCCSLSSCIFYRLSRAVTEMKYPEENVRFEVEEGVLSGTLVNPIAKLSDISTILGVKPDHMGENYYHFLFAKAGKNPDRQPWKIEVWIDKKKRIEKFALPKRLYETLGQPFIIEGFRAIGWSTVNVSRKTIYLEMTEKLTLKQAEEILGQPTEIVDERRKYRFKGQGHDFWITIWSDAHVQKVVLQSGEFFMNIDFVEEREDYHSDD